MEHTVRTFYPNCTTEINIKKTNNNRTTAHMVTHPRLIVGPQIKSSTWKSPSFLDFILVPAPARQCERFVPPTRLTFQGNQHPRLVLDKNNQFP